VDPDAFAEGSWPRWPLLAYFMLTEAGLAILGYALLRGDLALWIGWMLISSMVLLFLLTLIFRDMPPLMFYTVTLILGIALVTCCPTTAQGWRGKPDEVLAHLVEGSVSWSSTSSRLTPTR
jgi:hypothetical protein